MEPGMPDDAPDTKKHFTRDGSLPGDRDAPLSILRAGDGVRLRRVSCKARRALERSHVICERDASGSGPLDTKDPKREKVRND